MDFIPNELPMPILTERVSLRPVQVEDAPLIYEAVVESWTELSPWLVWTLNPLEKLSVKDYEDFCLRKQKLFSKGEGLTFLSFNRMTHKLLGGGGLHQRNLEDSSFSLGFWIRTSETGKGYATEVARSLTKYAFEKLGAKKIRAFHADDNEGSKNVLLKTGLDFVEVHPNAHKLLNLSVDEHHYVLRRAADDQRGHDE